MTDRGSAVAKWRGIFEVSTTVMMLALGVALVWESFHGSGAARGRDSIRKPIPVPEGPVTIVDRPFLGSADAKVGLLVYSDFQCPYCGVVARETIPKIIGEYVDTGRVAIVFKNMPLPNHALAAGAAAAGLCAGEQNRFWQMHDAMFALPTKLSQEELRETARSVGIDLRRYDVCRAEAAVDDHVKADRAEAARLGITGTPTFFLGTVGPGRNAIRVSDVITGAKPVAAFAEVLDRLLGEHKD